MAVAIVPVLMVVVGVLLFYLTERPKEVGWACFWAGLIGLAIEYAHHIVHIG